MKENADAIETCSFLNLVHAPGSDLLVFLFHYLAVAHITVLCSIHLSQQRICKFEAGLKVSEDVCREAFDEDRGKLRRARHVESMNSPRETRS